MTDEEAHTLRIQNDQLRHDAAHVINELDRLRAILAPFAAKGRAFAGLNPDGSRDDCPAPNSDGLTLGDYRRAAAAHEPDLSAMTGE